MLLRSDCRWARRRLRLHHAEGLLDAEERAGQVRVDDALPFGHVELVDRHAARCHAGVIEYEIDAAVARHDGVEQLAHVVGTCYVAGHRIGERARLGGDGGGAAK